MEIVRQGTLTIPTNIMHKEKNEMMKQRLAALIGIMSFCLLCRADQPESNALMMLKNGRNIFRFDTFGDQAFWGDTLKLHQSIEGADHGGVGPGVSPSTALAVGLKVDVDALPQPLTKKLAAGQVDLNDPATTLAPALWPESYAG